jgi:hypothetical protein
MQFKSDIKNQSWISPFLVENEVKTYRNMFYLNKNHGSVGATILLHI